MEGVVSEVLGDFFSSSIADEDLFKIYVETCRDTSLNATLTSRSRADPRTSPALLCYLDFINTGSKFLMNFNQNNLWFLLQTLSGGI